MPVFYSKTGYEGNYISTGNEFISLPRINLDGSVDAVGFFSSEFDACLEYVGRNNFPLISPYLNINDKNYLADFDDYRLISYWIPEFSKSVMGLEIKWTIITPITRKGFVCLLEIKNTNDNAVSFETGFKGTWSNVFETCKTLRKLNFQKAAKKHSFEPSSLTFNIQGITNYYSLSMLCEQKYDTNIDFCSLITNETEKEEPDICYNINKKLTLLPNETAEIPLYLGVAKKEIASLSIVKELISHGHKNLFSLLKKWLDKHIINNKEEKIKRLINENSFYNFFYTQAITIDTNELVITSARDSKSSYCGIYLDVDSMRWSQLAVQHISWNQSKKHLYYAFNKQSEHIGQRSRTINSHILDMGIQTDAICSPVMAVLNYVKQTGDKSILFSSVTQNNINYIQRLLSAQFDRKVYLLETLISPGGNYSSYPYICMQNVIAWKTYQDLSELYNIIRDIDLSKNMKLIAEKIKSDIYKYFIKDTDKGKIFCYATDLDNNYIFGNSKTLSLRLMPNFNFCSKNDPVYLNTINYLNEDPENFPKNSTEVIHDIINHLLTFDIEHIDEKYLNMVKQEDGFISSDPNGSLSGLLAHAIYKYFGGELPNASVAVNDEFDKEALTYRPPEVKLNSKKARIRG